jgi:hypothetical protein
MKIIGADERLAESRGVKALIVGPTGAGKTSLLRTLDPARTLLVDIEAGDLSVQDVPVDTIRVDDWTTARDLACRIGGPNPSLPANACYSEAHYQAVGGALDQIDRYDTIFVDSITAVSRLSFRWAEQQPEAFSERTGKKDVRGAYGLHAREMIVWLQHLQHARGKHVVFVGNLAGTDGRLTHRPRAARHRRPDRHYELGRLRGRRANTRIRVHVAEPLGVPRQRSRWPARADRGATPRQAHREADQPRRA